MANKRRGEVTIKLDGKEYTMRPTFQAICEIEDRLDMGIPSIISKLYRADLRMSDTAVIIQVGINAAKDSSENMISLEDAGNLIRESNLMDVCNQQSSLVDTDGKTKETSSMSLFLLNGITGSRVADPTEGGKEEEEKPPKS